MDDTFFSHPASQELPFHEDSPAKFVIPPLTLLENLEERPPTTHLSKSIHQIELSLKSLSTLYQSKATAVSTTPKVTTMLVQGELFQGQALEVYYSDQSRNHSRSHNSYHYCGKRLEFGELQAGGEIRGQKSLESFQGEFQNQSRVRHGSKRGKDSESSSTPKIPTRNILQYFWKVIKNYFTGKNQQHLSESQGQTNHMKTLWQQVNSLKPSLASFSKLFKNKEMRPFLSQLFKSRFLMREIMRSSLRSNTKITYLRYVKILLKGFLTGDLLFLN